MAANSAQLLQQAASAALAAAAAFARAAPGARQQQQQHLNTRMRVYNDAVYIMITEISLAADPQGQGTQQQLFAAWQPLQHARAELAAAHAEAYHLRQQQQQIAGVLQDVYQQLLIAQQLKDENQQLRQQLQQLLQQPSQQERRRQTVQSNIVDSVRARFEPQLDGVQCSTAATRVKAGWAHLWLRNPRLKGRALRVFGPSALTYRNQPVFQLVTPPLMQLICVPGRTQEELAITLRAAASSFQRTGMSGLKDVALEMLYSLRPPAFNPRPVPMPAVTELYNGHLSDQDALEQGMQVLAPQQQQQQQQLVVLEYLTPKPIKSCAAVEEAIASKLPAGPIQARARELVAQGFLLCAAGDNWVWIEPFSPLDGVPKGRLVVGQGPNGNLSDVQLRDADIMELFFDVRHAWLLDPRAVAKGYRDYHRAGGTSANPDQLRLNTLKLMAALNAGHTSPLPFELGAFGNRLCLRLQHLPRGCARNVPAPAPGGPAPAAPAAPAAAAAPGAAAAAPGAAAGGFVSFNGVLYADDDDDICPELLAGMALLASEAAGCPLMLHPQRESGKTIWCQRGGQLAAYGRSSAV